MVKGCQEIIRDPFSLHLWWFVYGESDGITVCPCFQLSNIVAGVKFSKCFKVKLEQSMLPKLRLLVKMKWKHDEKQ